MDIYIYIFFFLFSVEIKCFNRSKNKERQSVETEGQRNKRDSRGGAINLKRLPHDAVSKASII